MARLRKFVALSFFGLAFTPLLALAQPKFKFLEKPFFPYNAAIESVRRAGNPSTAVAFTPRAFSPPGVDVLYDTTDVSVSFEVKNQSGAPLNGYVTASMRNANDYTNPSSFAVQNLAPATSVKGTVSAGRPLGAGTQTVHLYWRDAATPALSQGGFKWTETDTLTVNVAATPRYVKRAPYDLAFEDVDPNGFPLNARFGKQDEFFYKTGSRDLWQTAARPHIWDDCLKAAERQTGVSANNDYNAFENGYCKHSPGVLNSILDPAYCRGDKQVDGYQPGGTIYCASWSWKDDPFLLKCGTSPYLTPFHIEGHINFTVATYEGIARWDNAQAEYNFDSDWCMDLYTFHGVGISNQQDELWIHTEHDPKNVGDGFDRGFWKEFRDKIKNGQEYCGDLQFCQGTKNNQAKTVGPLINGKRAIVIGLLGLDMGHSDAGSELHPVYGMAIHTGARPRSQSGYIWDPNPRVDDNVYLHPESDPWFDTPQNANDDTWAIWAANFGSEGYCSTRALHVLDGDESIIGRKVFPTMGFRLPWTNYVSADGNTVLPMADVEVLDSTNFTLKAKPDVARNNASYSVFTDRGKSVTIIFDMLPSSAEPYWFGELHLKWKAPPAAFAEFKAAALYLKPPEIAAKSQVAKSNEAENPTISRMTEAQKSAFVAQMKNRGATPPLVINKSLVGTRRVVNGPAPAPPPPIQPHAPATLKALASGGAEENAAAKRSICAAYRGKVPNAPADYCK